MFSPESGQSALSRSTGLTDSIAAWLLTASVRDADYGTLVEGLGRRLLSGGIAVHRVNIGGVIVHPVMGARDAVWEADSQSVRHDRITRNELLTPAMQNSPFFSMAYEQQQFYRLRLDGQDASMPFPILGRLRDQGYTDYFASFMSYGRSYSTFGNLPASIEGALASFTTRRLGGFTDEEIDDLKRLHLPLSAAIKSSMTNDFALTLMHTYVGTYSAEQVAKGRISRGDAQTTRCVIWYSDLRDCSGLAASLPGEQYLALLNQYFDCTAGAIIDHGGEVLKFIGDAVLAIFPIIEPDRPAADMCRAAVMATREALQRARAVNDRRARDGVPTINFGAALHLGDVMYGNVGTARRLDFTVIGRAVNEVARLEKCCKTLRKRVVASEEFCRAAPQTSRATPFDLDPALGVSAKQAYVLDDCFDRGIIAWRE